MSSIGVVNWDICFRGRTFLWKRKRRCLQTGNIVGNTRICMSNYAKKIFTAAWRWYYSPRFTGAHLHILQTVDFVFCAVKQAFRKLLSRRTVTYDLNEVMTCLKSSNFFQVYHCWFTALNVAVGFTRYALWKMSLNWFHPSQIRKCDFTSAIVD